MGVKSIAMPAPSVVVGVRESKSFGGYHPDASISKF
jgi:hypothetical protein